MKWIWIFIVFLTVPEVLHSQVPANEMYSLSMLKYGMHSRHTGSSDNIGGNNDRLINLQPGTTVTLMDVKGAGIITHIWITLYPGNDQVSWNDLILKKYWDGKSYPSVESPIGPFFGNGWNESYPLISAPLCVAPALTKSCVCYCTMLFSAGARIEIENQTDDIIRALYYNIAYYETETLPKEMGRFHAWYNHEVTTGLPAIPGGKFHSGNNRTGEGNYLFAEIKGKGHLAGVNYYINKPNIIWYGEGDEMIFIDGDTLPVITGTGTEDFFNTSFAPKELFTHPYFRFARVNNETGWLGHTHAYRFFIADPVVFDSSCRFTIEHGHENQEVLDLASVTYWYQDEASPLPKSFKKDERIHMLRLL